MASSTLKDVFLKKYKDTEVLSLINRKMLIHKQLQKPPRTYVVYSDLHGSYEKFLHWLKNGLGYYKIAVKDFLGKAYSEEILHIYEYLLYIVNKAKLKANRYSLAAIHATEYLEYEVDHDYRLKIYGDPETKKIEQNHN